jgi:hypothetical protein
MRVPGGEARGARDDYETAATGDVYEKAATPATLQWQGQVRSVIMTRAVGEVRMPMRRTAAWRCIVPGRVGSARCADLLHGLWRTPPAEGLPMASTDRLGGQKGPDRAVWYRPGLVDSTRAGPERSVTRQRPSRASPASSVSAIL